MSGTADSGKWTRLAGKQSASRKGMPTGAAEAG